MNRIKSYTSPRGGFQPPAAAPPAGRQGPRALSEVQEQRRIAARFDSQFTTDENRRQWQFADATSIDAAANWMVRRQLRMRARYEYHNNSWFMGMADTIGNYVIGTGPRLQMLTDDKPLNVAIQKTWNSWAKEVQFAQTLKNMRMARLYNGEAFALLRSNPNLDNPVKLDLFEVEADQVSSPLFGLYPAQYPDQYFDGVVLDPWGRPQEYHILRQHPGAFGAFVIMGYEFDRWPARYVLHDYKRIRPGQQRGVPEIIPGLESFAKIRRYSAAVIDAAETAAEHVAVIQSDAGADDEEGGGADVVRPMDRFELRPRLATVLPAGWSLSQLKAEQPTANTADFINCELAEIARCCNFPLFFMTLDARLANMSSAYVACQPFYRAAQVDRAGYEHLADRVFDEFLTEALRVSGLFPKEAGGADEFPHAWRWPKVGQHADPAKTAVSQATSLASGTTSLPLLIGEEGYDWEEVQISAAKALGMSLDEYRAALRQKMFSASGNPPPAALDPEPDPAPDIPEGEEAAEEENNVLIDD